MQGGGLEEGGVGPPQNDRIMHRQTLAGTGPAGRKHRTQAGMLQSSRGREEVFNALVGPSTGGQEGLKPVMEGN